jgi:septal ring factor EnvC (AmiA/AmiB activator)
MKKLVLVVVWILLIAVFVVLNYLIWDRENRERDIKSLENLNASNNSSITALGREINNLETQKKRMEAEISYLEKTMADLEDANSKIAKENQKYLETIKHKNKKRSYIFGSLFKGTDNTNKCNQSRRCSRQA